MEKHLSFSKMLSRISVMMLYLILVFKAGAAENLNNLAVDENTYVSTPELSLQGAMAEAISETDSLILVNFYNNNNGPNWTNKTNWLSGPLKTWYGIKVVADEITEIRLKNNNITGTIPADFGSLSSLQFIDLDTNKLTGSIPVELANLSNLQYLYLDGNQLSGSIPGELSQIPNLLLLYLSDNQFTGSIPAEFGSFPLLKWLKLNNNQLTGTIPVELGDLPSIEFLNLSFNQISGAIPVELGQLSTLKWLNLSENLLSGSIPVELGQLSAVSLAQLYLNKNQLSGTIPAEIGNLTGLRWLNLGQNQLTGAIPVEFGQLINLSLLYADGNLLEGSIPLELGQINTMEWLNLSQNQLTGTIPSEIWDLSNLKLLYLNGNKLTGTIPSVLDQITELKWLILNSNELSSMPDLTLPANLMELNISDNKLAFDHIEYNMDLIPAVNFSYSPQDSIGAIQKVTKAVGDPYSYALVTGGTQNSYQWYLNGEILASQTSATLDIASIATNDAGDYHCEVTNTLVPGLTLISRPIILSVSESLEITFNEGWNIFSSPLMPVDKDLKNILQPLIDEGKLKKVIDENGKTIEDWGIYGSWRNDIGDMKSTEGYKINVISDATINMNGVPAQLPIDIELNTGWNIISWPSANEQDGMDVFQTLIDGNILKKVMDETGKVIEDFGIYGGWKNFIGNFKSGEGYKVNVTSDATLTITEGGVKSVAIAPAYNASEHFTPGFKGNGVDHMNINLVNLMESGIKVGDEIGIFDGDLCVGGVKVINENLSFLNLIASATDDRNDMQNGFLPGNEITMKLFRNGVEQSLEIIPVNSASSQFVKNGTLFAKLNTELSTLSVKNTNEFDVDFYPNPFNEILTIEINLQQRQELNVEVYDLLSRRVRQLHSGQAEGLIKLQWDGNDSDGNRMAPGVYLCRVNGLLKKVVLN